jgi:hypothetical protein
MVDWHTLDLDVARHLDLQQAVTERQLLDVHLEVDQISSSAAAGL